MLDEISIILEDLKNSNSEIRELALDKIGTLKPSNSLEIILPFLSDSEPEVRSTAACNLGEIQDSRAIPYLINIVKDDNNKEVRADALSALGEYQSSEDKVMLQTFKATLKGDSLEWAEKVRGNLRGDTPVQVLVTILEEEPSLETKGRGQRMAAALEKLAQAQAFAGIDPVVWQQNVRQDRELPGRNE